MKADLKSLSADETGEFVKELGLEPYRADKAVAL